MCKGRFHEVTCIAVKRVRRFEGEIQPAPDVESDEGDLQLEAAVCMYCGDGGDADRLMLCDSEACPNVRKQLFICVPVNYVAIITGVGS